MGAWDEIRNAYPALTELRRKLGAELFRAALPPNLDEDSVANLMQMPDQRTTSAGG